MVLLCFFFFSQTKIALTSGTSLQDRMLRYLNIKHKKVCLFVCLFSLPLAIASAYSVLKHWNNKLLSSLNSCSFLCVKWTSDESKCSSCFVIFQMISLAAAFLCVGSSFQLCFTSDHSTVGSVTAGRLDRLSMSEHLTGEILSEIWLVSFFLSFFLQLTNIYFQFLCITCNSLPQ